LFIFLSISSFLMIYANPTKAARILLTNAI
jgi:hypothetical protein